MVRMARWGAQVRLTTSTVTSVTRAALLSSQYISWDRPDHTELERDSEEPGRPPAVRNNISYIISVIEVFLE